MSKRLKTLICGIVAGTALGILLSPKKGKDIRKSLKKEIDEGGFGLKTVRQTFAAMGRDISGTAQETYEEVKQSPQYKQGKSKAKGVVKKAVSKAKSKFSKIKED